MHYLVDQFRIKLLLTTTYS